MAKKESFDGYEDNIKTLCYIFESVNTEDERQKKILWHAGKNILSLLRRQYNFEASEGSIYVAWGQGA